MVLSANRKRKILRTILYGLVLGALIAAISCKRSGTSSGIDILGPADDTAEAAKLVEGANEDLQKIKVLYKNNENKREDLKKALEANDADKVRKISDDVVYLINDGSDNGKSAVDKIEKAQEMQINDDYREYLRLKEESLKKEMDAFEEYRQAAIVLRNSYDPKNAAVRDRVKDEFKNRSENYRSIMESARDYSNQANELAKEALRKQKE
jgi:hypothetical protein